MHFLPENKSSYASVMSRLSVLTVLSIIGCIMLGYLVLPLAAGFYASVLLYEKKSKRILSYAIPAVMFTVNLLARGLYTLEAVAYVAVGLIIYLGFTRRISKGETVFWMTLLVALLILLSAILLPFELSGSVGVISIKQFYSNLYGNYRTFFVEQITSLTKTTSDGMNFFAFNTYEAEKMFSELVIYLIPLLAVFAFLLSGISLKIFSRTVMRYSGEESGIAKWDFKTSNTVAYFFIAVSILTLLNDFNGSVFDFTLTSLNTIFSAVFAYIGIKNVFRFFTSRGRSVIFTVIIMLVISALLASNIVSVLSYLGVFVNILMNKSKREAK